MGDFLWYIPVISKMNKYLSWIFALLPSFSLAAGLMDMANNSLYADLYAAFDIDEYKKPLSMELLGPRLILMAIETTFLFFLHVSIELQWFQKLERFLINWKHDSSGNGNTNPSHGTRTNHTENNGSEDEDVALERKRVEKNI